jgi:hypothetical protein
LAVASGKKAERQARLDERAAAIQMRMDAERRMRNIIIVVFAAVIVFGGLGIYFFATYQPPSNTHTTSAPKAAYAVPDEGAGHIPACQPNYQHKPPSSGCHASVQGVAPAVWQAYTTALPPEDWVHNLEHGGIVLVYRCSGTECSTIYGEAFKLFALLPKEKYNEIKLVTTPYQDMTPKYALLAWDQEQDLDTLDVNAVKAFYQSFVDHGREDLP